MAKKMKSYKRSEERPIIMTDAHKKDLGLLDKSSTVLRYALIALVLLTLIFSMLPLFRIDVKSEQLDTIAGDAEKYGNISFFDLIGGWFEKASYNYADRGINVGYVYPHVFDYLVAQVPALKTAIGMGSMGQEAIFGAITPKQDKMLDSAYMVMLAVEIISLVWLVVLALLFIFSFVKKMKPTTTCINVAVIIHFVLTFIMFAFTLGLSSNSTKEFMFSVGIGMWMNLLIAVLMLSVSIFNMIYKAKVKAHEEAML